MSGRDEREDYVLETTMTPVQADNYRIDQQEQVARNLIPTIRRIFEDAKKRDKKEYRGFWLGNLYFSNCVSSNSWFKTIDTIRYKKRFFSLPVVFEYEYAGSASLSKILKFRSGIWTEELAGAEILSHALLREHWQKQEDDLKAVSLRERKKRMRELGLDMDD